MVILGGWVFLESEVPLYWDLPESGNLCYKAKRMKMRICKFRENTGVPPANKAHIRQSRPDSGLGFQAKVLENF